MVQEIWAGIGVIEYTWTRNTLATTTALHEPVLLPRTDHLFYILPGDEEEAIRLTMRACVIPT